MQNPGRERVAKADVVSLPFTETFEEIILTQTTTV